MSTAHIQTAADILTRTCHEAALASGWWTDPDTGLLKPYNTPEKLCLVHSEISEAMEGFRKDANDEHLPHRKSFEVELADAVIRIFDLAGRAELDLGAAISEKLAYNAQRADHKPANRAKAGGKKF